MRTPMAVVAMAAALSANASGQEFPKAWRAPRAAELDDGSRNDSPSKFTVAHGDFNGDGVSDSAFILKSTNSADEALWVDLSTPEGGRRWLLLERQRWPRKYKTVNVAMGVEQLPAGVVAYACFQEAKECNFGPTPARPKLKLRDPAIIYFKPESAASLFFWSGRHQRFLRVWLSD